jgi:regulatory protein
MNVKKISLDSIYKPDHLAGIEHEQMRKSARSAAIRYIGVFRKTSGNLREYLCRQSFDPTIIQEVLAELIEEGYIDDQKQARYIIRERQAGKSESQAAIRNRMIRHGVSENVIDSLTSDLTPDEDSAASLIRSRFVKELVAYHQSDKIEKNRLLGKLNRFLQSRGYSFECIRKIIREALAEQDLDTNASCDDLANYGI